jgi:F-type H+-transporting ATPase subunit delta
MTGGSTIELNTEIDPAILGGFILRIGDLQYNASIANQFQKIKQEFSKSI